MILSDNHELFMDEIVNDFTIKFKRFNEFQIKAVETLFFFHNVCEKYEIPYYLAYGSLLGAIRDGGQIPWDYDVDVQVPVKYADKLIEVLQIECADKYHFITRFTDKRYRTYTLKLAPVGFDCEILHVDVFWLYGMENNEFNGYKRKVKKYSNILLYKYLPYKYFMISRKSEKIMYIFNKFVSKLYFPSFIDMFFKRLFLRDINDYEYITDNDNSTLLRKEWLENRILLKCYNGAELYIPEGYDYILKQLFGNYNSFPSIDSRVNEFTRSLKRLNQLGKI